MSATGARSAAERARRDAHVAALDHVLFGAPFVLIDAANSSPARVTTLHQARAALARADIATVAGRLRPGVLAADIDPDHDQAVLGDAVADHLLSWCQRHQLPYLVRESGRPGGRHVLAVTADPALTAGWAALCTRLAQRHGVVVDDRTAKALRLLTAPHRIALPAPILGGTLTPADVLNLDVLNLDAPAGGRDDAAARRRAPRAPRSPHGRDTSRSAAEYGDACAHARAGHTAAQAWAAADLPGSKAHERGETHWRRYTWLLAVTMVAAEQNLTEDAAWQLALGACRPRCVDRGRAWWRGLWRRAQHEATRDRPRRYRLTSATTTASTTPVDPAQLAALRSGLLAAARDLLPRLGARPQRVHSACAYLHAIAPTLFTERAGAISQRQAAELARLDPKTVRAASTDLRAAGILALAHRYSGGSRDSHAYALGQAAEPYLAAEPGTAEADPQALDQPSGKTSPTSCSTPSRTPLGTANLRRLRTTHQAERASWSLRCTLAAVLAGTGETFATSDHQAAKTLRSLFFQRRWWSSLSPDERAHRCAVRRVVLDQLSSVDQSAWLDWLSRREHLRLVAERILTGPTDLAVAPVSGDRAALAAAPMIVHRGMRDPQWRTGGTPAHAGPDQLAFAA